MANLVYAAVVQRQVKLKATKQGAENFGVTVPVYQWNNGTYTTEYPISIPLKIHEAPAHVPGLSALLGKMRDHAEASADQVIFYNSVVLKRAYELYEGSQTATTITFAQKSPKDLLYILFDHSGDKVYGEYQIPVEPYINVHKRLRRLGYAPLVEYQDKFRLPLVMFPELKTFYNAHQKLKKFQEEWLEKLPAEPNGSIRKAISKNLKSYRNVLEQFRKQTIPYIATTKYEVPFVNEGIPVTDGQWAAWGGGKLQGFDIPGDDPARNRFASDRAKNNTNEHIVYEYIDLWGNTPNTFNRLKEKFVDDLTLDDLDEDPPGVLAARALNFYASRVQGFFFAGMVHYTGHAGSTFRPNRDKFPNSEGEPMTFKDLQIIPPILKALAKENYTNPTPIQSQAIPAVLAGRDLFGCAQTGTGKTAAFAIPIIQHLSQQQSQPNTQRRIRSLILTPTRELAIQIYDNIRAYGRYTNLRSSVIVGGVSQKAQEQSLQQGADIVIATPGRLIDLMNQQLIDLRHVQILVLDEADRMLDMGFIHDMKRIIAKLPAKRQTLFFSATLPPEISKLVETLLVNPVKVEITPASSTVDRIEQSMYYVDKVNKLNLLNLLLQDRSIVSVLVFTRTKHGADRVVRGLTKAKISAQAIHGDKSQNARQAALNNFKSGATRVLVATDIAARGIDIEELSHVINYNLPNIPETYVHRIGRTGRAGHSGIAISFCEYDEIPYLKDIEKLIRKRIPEVKDHPYPMLNTEAAAKADTKADAKTNAGKQAPTPQKPAQFQGRNRRR